MNPGRKNNMRKKIINNKNKNCPQPQSSLSSTTIAKYNMKKKKEEATEMKPPSNNPSKLFIDVYNIYKHTTYKKHSVMDGANSV